MPVKNKKIYECTLSFKNRIRAHAYQAIAGFISLEKMGIISLKIEYNNDIHLPMENVFRCRVNDINVYYDVEDGTENLLPDFEDYLHKENSILFKRAYEEKLYKNDILIRPYGFNYIKRTNTLLDRPTSFLAKRGLLPLPTRIFRHLFSNIDEWSFAGRTRCYPIKILFCSRLWSPQDTHSPVEEINENRIRTIISLRQAFQNKIVAGVADSSISRKICKDLILPTYITNRKKYLELIKSSAICIATTGLHRSIGWKFGEYVASGKVIVSEPLLFKVPGDFRERHNYLSFSSSEELIEKCNYLLSHPEISRKIEQNNTNYYFNYLRPDVLIWNTIKQAIDYNVNFPEYLH